MLKFADEHTILLQNLNKRYDEVSEMDAIASDVNIKTRDALSTKEDEFEQSLRKLTHLSDTNNQCQNELVGLNANTIDKIKTLKQKSAAIIAENKNQDLERLLDEHRKLRAYRKLAMVAYKKAFEYYTACYNIEIDVEELQENRYTAVVKFKIKDRVCDFPIRLVIDSANKTVIDFNVDSICTNEESLELKNWFRVNGQLPALFCRLRKMVFRKVENDSR